MTRTIRWLALGLILTLAACGREEAPAPPAASPPGTTPSVSAPTPFRVGSIQLGNQIGADKRVLAAAESFSPGDTIYASITTQGEAQSAVVLAARWSYEDGQTVAESSETVASAGPTVVEFHISSPEGWPTGRYRVDVTANGAPAGTRQFEVR